MSQFSKEELSFVKEVPEQIEIECPVCLHILTDPHQVTCCGYNFCGSCIEIIKARNGPCPMCKEKEYQSFIDKKCSRIINGLEVYCSNKEKGCQWKGELKNMSTHLNKEKREGECQYEEVKCRFKECQERKQRKYLKDHEDKKCLRRPFYCEYCLEGGTILSVRYHYEECRRYPVTCPNKCSPTNMPRGSLTAHINECPLEPVDCVFSWAGCNDKPLRKDVHIHTADTKHMTLLAVACGQLKIEIEQIKEENEKMKEENELIKQHVGILQNENAILPILKDPVHNATVPNSYPLLPIEIRMKNKTTVYFYTGACGRHMSARILDTGGWNALLFAFHEGKFDKHNPQLPNIFFKYQFDGINVLPFKVLDDIEATYELLPDDVLDTITGIDDIPSGVTIKKNLPCSVPMIKIYSE
uniref:RING-type domain-containing protein n=1 Tax=Amphimedon queenslandica TaxID=400682 RepID=A0A1X7UY34_AMPQE